MTNVIKFKKLSKDAVVPKRETDGSVGMDLATTGEFSEGPTGVYYWKTGLAVEPPEGYYFEIHPRSSLHKKGWMLVNSTGIIDSDYRGELIVALLPIITELSEPESGAIVRVADVMLEPKTRIAQLILRKNELIEMTVEETEDLTDTRRGSGGFGSTDIKK